MTATTTTQTPTPGAAVARPLRPGCPSAQPACARPSLPPPPRPAGCARPARRLSVPGPAFAFQRRLLSHAPRQTSSPPDRRPGQARAPADDALAAPRPFPRDGRPLVPSPLPDPDAHTGRVCRGGDNAETPPAPRRLLARAACSSAPPPGHARGDTVPCEASLSPLPLAMRGVVGAGCAHPGCACPARRLSGPGRRPPARVARPGLDRGRRWVPADDAPADELPSGWTSRSSSSPGRRDALATHGPRP